MTGRRWVHIGIVATFALVSFWVRLPGPPLFFPDLFVTRFAAFWIMMATIGVWLVAGMPGFAEVRRDRRRALWLIILLLLVLWAFASENWAYVGKDYPDVAQTAALQLATAVLFVVVMVCAAPPRRWIMLTLMLGTLANSPITTLQAALQQRFGLRILGEYQIDAANPQAVIVQMGDQRWLRPYGFLPHPNMLAGFLVIGLLVTLVWVMDANRRKRWAGTLVFVAGWWSLLLTFSRSGIGGLAVGLLVACPLLIRSKLSRAAIRQLAVTGGLALLALGLFVVIYIPQIQSRTGLGTPQMAEEESVEGRALLVGIALEAVKAYPLQGVGIGNFPWYASYAFYNRGDYQSMGNPVHHVLLSVWAELGLVGLALVVAALVWGVEMGLMKLHEGRSQQIGRGDLTSRPYGDTQIQERYTRILLLSGVIALMAIGLLDHYPWTIFPFQILWWGGLAMVVNE